jgi:acyl-CoA synthetase (AMP-forming)/AMP-acid ligase II
MATLLNSLSSKLDSPALIVPSQTKPIILSHRQLLEQVLKFQQKLAAIGISPKEAVAIAFPNTIEFAIAFLATTLQRATSAPLNPAYKQEEFEFYLRDLNATVILLPKGAVVEGGEAVRAARKCGSAIAEIYWDGEEINLDVLESGRLEDKSGVKVQEPSEGDVALILHTSGTTGRPKAVSILNPHVGLWILITPGTSEP